ncbi:MAG: hypothetical protein F6K35_37295 [Okeania sp. SIO2H7]|nr:hypothetical protein [Okeania sp. SIO2H7]
MERSNHLRWLSRVPASLKEAQELMSQISNESLRDSALQGYSFTSTTSVYAGLQQRWLVVESYNRYVADLKQLERKITKASEIAQKQLNRDFLSSSSRAYLMQKRPLPSWKNNYDTIVFVQEK